MIGLSLQGPRCIRYIWYLEYQINVAYLRYSVKVYMAKWKVKGNTYFASQDYDAVSLFFP